MRKVAVIEEKTRELFEGKLEYHLGDNTIEIVDIKYAVTDEKYTALIIYRLPSSVG